MYELKSWDGTRKRIADHGLAVKWIRDHLSGWMQKGDYIQYWAQGAGLDRIYYVIDGSDGGRTDSCVWMRRVLEGDINGGCFKCQRALDLSTARHDTRKKLFGVYLDWLWIADCVNDDCDAVTMIMESRDATRWPHRAYKFCEVQGCIYKSVYRICMECMKDLSGRMRGDVAVARPGAVERALELIPKKHFITKED